MSMYGRSGRSRPGSGGWELAIWYLMRLTGLGLFVLVLSHYLILHVLYDPAQQHAGWIAEVRWSSTFWRAFDWLMLMLVLFHGFMGVRTVVADDVLPLRMMKPSKFPKTPMLGWKFGKKKSV